MELYLFVLSFISLHPVYLDLITVFPHLPLRKQQISHPYQLHKKKTRKRKLTRENSGKGTFEFHETPER